MQSIYIFVEYVGIIAILCELFYIIRQKPSKLQRYLIFILIACFINFVGYLFEMEAKSQEEALVAVKMIYFAKPYLVLSSVLFIMEYCRIKIPKWLICILGCIHMFIHMLVQTCENNNLYYSSIDFTYDGVFPHLVMGHSPIYIAYNVLIFIYMLCTIAACRYRYKRVNTRNERNSVLCLLGISVVSVGGLIIFLSGVTDGYDSTVPAYMISSSLLFISLIRYNLLDALSFAKDVIVDELENGLVVFDTNDKMIYANIQAVTVYPELGTMESPNKQDITVNRRLIHELDEMYSLDERVHRNDNVYKLSRKKLVSHDIEYGTIYSIDNVTQSYQYTINLEKQKAIAEQANKAKSDFLARMSHEIRTPINSVLGMNEMILRESGEKHIKGYAANIKMSANTLLSLINDILDSSKIESGKLDIIPVKYGLDSMINDIVNMISFKAKEKNLGFKLDIDRTLPIGLFGDDVRIRQVIINLLTNAVKYTNEGYVLLRMNGVVNKKTLKLRVEIKDTGIGIKREDLPKLFDSFKRIEEERNRNIEGTGLGMNIVVSLLKLMNSKLDVNSVYGKGSLFSFEIEQEIVDSRPIGEFEKRFAEVSEGQKYKESFTAPEARLLVVDDNDINRVVFKNLLKQTKVQITDVASGEACIQAVKKEHYDIIFLDHMMPQMDGVECFNIMKEMEDNKCKDTPIIVLTANAVSGAKEEYLRIGFNDFLSKSIIPDKLEEMIRNNLKPELVNLSK